MTDHNEARSSPYCRSSISSSSPHYGTLPAKSYAMESSTGALLTRETPVASATEFVIRATIGCVLGLVCGGVLAGMWAVVVVGR